MLRSMTGYGRGECVMHDRKFLVEIKSVNHRYNDITVKLPRILNSLEEGVRKATAQKLLRGKADVYVSYETFSAEDVKIRTDTILADAYVEQLRFLANRCGIKEDVSLDVLCRFPDIMTMEKNAYDEGALCEMRDALMHALEEALARHSAMREKEGVQIKNDITEKNARLSESLREVERRAPIAREESAVRFRNRLAEMLADAPVDQSRLAQEIAIMADRACVDEEITRLKSHIMQFGLITEQDEPVGRKLDFLVQEMNREINTIGSKTNDIETTGIVVEMKSELEKIREQIQNIE